MRSKAKRGETIAELFEAYAAKCLSEDSKRPDTVKQDRKVFDLFSEFVGSDRAVRSIGRDDIREWRNLLMVLPPKFRSKKGYSGLTIRQAAEKAKAEGATTLTPTTINKYLSTVSPWFDWCRREGYADINPCDGLFFNLPKGKRRRPSYTVEQLNHILSSPLFCGFLADGKEHVPGSKRADDWRFWILNRAGFAGG